MQLRLLGLTAVGFAAALAFASIQPAAAQVGRPGSAVTAESGQALTVPVRFKGQARQGRGAHAGLGRGVHAGRGTHAGFGRGAHAGFGRGTHAGFGRSAYGGRHSGYRHGGYGYRHGGGYGRGAAIGAGIAGLAAGAVIGGALAAAPGYQTVAPDDAVAYCQSRFRSYDPALGTYLGYDGFRHPCP